MNRRDVLKLGGATVAAAAAGAVIDLSPRPVAAQAPKRGGVFRIAGVDPLGFDPHTVKFTLKEPFAWSPDALASTSAWLIPREAVEQYGDLKKAEACIGTGPWMLERYEPSVRLTFVRHPDYFVPGLPYADGVD